MIFTAVIVGTRSAGEAAGMSAFVQAFGHAVAALSGPPPGAMRSGPGARMVPLSVLARVTILFAVFTLAATALAHRHDHSGQA